MSALWVENLKDERMKNIVQIATNVAPRKATVLISGESGVGKELLARHIHESSERKSNAFVAVNCAAVPENLLESELFGYDKGAFTGAQATKPGKFEIADKGTFLLDEISEMPLSLQGKLLRVLQEGEIERLGSTQLRKIDVRFICTSNRNLAEMVQAGSFRQDLFYRLNVIPLEIPPLRERKVDLSSLVHYFLKKVADDNQIEMKSLSSEAMTKLNNWSWPGNIRELQNVIERSCLMSENQYLSSQDIQIEAMSFVAAKSKEDKIFSTGMTIQEAERRLILKTLESTGENRTQAAKILGISIRTLRNKLNEYKTESDLNL